MTIHIPKWILAAFVGAAPMLAIVFVILFSCTLIGLVQRCKISLTKSYAKRRRRTSHDQSSFDLEQAKTAILFEPVMSTVIVSPFDDIPMRDIDADESSKAYSEPKDDLSDSLTFQRNRSIDHSQAGSDYDNGSSSIFTDNDYEQDRLSLIESSSQRRVGSKQVKPADTIIHV